jgi:anti-sigma regulatory factor (Ser/Thr protein kinase)
MSALAESRLPAFAHMIYPYAGTGEYLSGTLAYIDRARQAGATVVIAAPENRRADFGGQLPDDEHVIFMDITAIGRNPGRLIPAWREWISQKAATSVVHGINEPTWAAPRRTAAQLSEARYEEWLLNLAFAQAPAWSLLCPVDTVGRQPEVIEAMTRCHPLVWNGTDRVASADYLADAFDFDDLPEPPSNAVRIPYSLANLAELREQVLRWAVEYVPIKRARDLTLSVSEVATNSIRYGGGTGTLAFWREDGALVCDLRDSGVISDPLAGWVRPDPDRLGGRGLWFVRQLCDLVQIRSAPERGTCARLWIDEPSPLDPPR